MNYQRVAAKLTLDVSVSAERFYTELVNWHGIINWENAPVAMKKVDLAPGHQLGKVPCSRLVYVDMERLPPGVPRETVPEVISETLLAFDPVARTILYQLDGEGPMGMRNYFATTEVDELGPDSARVTSTGRCDLPQGVPPEAIQTLLTETYRRGVIGGTAGILKGKVIS